VSNAIIWRNNFHLLFVVIPLREDDDFPVKISSLQSRYQLDCALYTDIFVAFDVAQIAA
jgi:hypothetical protein